MIRDTLRRRSAFTAEVRAFFTEEDYLETETPLLAPWLIPESAIEVFKAPFKDPNRPPGRDFFLVPSPELWMKRLIAGGYGNIFQISKAFRNAESIGNLHNPEFTILEYYTVQADHLRSIEVTEELFRRLLSRGHARIPDTAALEPPFRRMTMAQAFWDYAGFDLGPCTAGDLKEEARRLGIRTGEDDDWETAFNRIFVDRVEPALPQDHPLVLLDYPRELRCLAREIPGTPWRARWELYLRGMETANCFAEETDPRKVAAYFRAEEELKEEALVPHPPDRNFLSLYRGKYPPTSGVAVGFDRLFMAFAGISQIQGVILFPFSDILEG